MPINRDDMEQGDSPMTPPEGDIEERELFAPVPMPVLAPEPVPELEQPTGKWQSIGSPDYPDAKRSPDGISDLFTVTPEDVGASDEDLSDLTDVDIDRDIVDADEDGSLDDLTRVTEEDIMGFEGFGQRPSKSASQQPKARRRISRYQPPTSLGGMR